MKKIVIVLAILALAVPAFAVSPNVRISQVYGGGGSASTTATYNVDYVELFNAAGVDINISGWTIEYGSATGSWGSSAGNIFTFPAGSWIAGCSYVLCQFGTPSAGGGPLPVTADYIAATPSMGGVSGKVALFNAVNANLACGFELPGTLVDKVSYGVSNCAETTPTPVLSVTTGAVRNGAGLTDTDNNLADFAIVTGPIPRNRATTAWACAPVATQGQTWGALKSIFR